MIGASSSTTQHARGGHGDRSGSVTVATVPPPSRSVSSIVPPWDSTIQRAIASPSPVPDGRIARARVPR